MSRFAPIKYFVKPTLFLLSLLPAAILAWNTATDALSANPIKDITEETGTWTLRFLLITLSVTPLQKLTRLGWISSFRRMFGLYAFFYGSLHFVTYIYLDQFLDLGEILADVSKRPFIAVGFASFVLMVPLAVTSPNFMVRWLGGKRWKILHRAVYAVALGGVIHYLWLVKADTSRPLRYGAALLFLFTIRLWFTLKGKWRINKPAGQGK